VLDMVYAGFGWTCYEPVPVTASGPTRFEVPFPDFWVGPVCVTAAPPDDQPDDHPDDQPAAETITFAWQRWKLDRGLGREEVTFTFCRIADDRPLIVEVPTGWQVTAHVGQHPDAVDANADWVPVDAGAAEWIFDHYVARTLTQLGRGWNELQAVLGSDSTASNAGTKYK
jgi:hypothetical protein